MKNEFIAVRGAVTVRENTAEDITHSAVRLLSDMLRVNNIDKNDIVSVIFSTTDDINKMSPAAAVRHAGLVPPYAALFCTQEAYIQNSLPMCIRILLNAKSTVLMQFVRHVYLDGAVSLRPDLAAKPFQIAIDGPSGAGKTTIANLVANKMNISYLDTGAIYRTIAVYARSMGVSPTDEDGVEDIIDSVKVVVRFVGKKQRMFVNGLDVTDKIREHSISKDASDISAHLSVRNLATKIAQETAASQSIVMEGRDICAYVLPDAEFKFYLDAAVAVRARRRFEELIKKGQAVVYDDILSDIERRDYNDMNRKNMPLKRTDDAVYIDASQLTVDEIFEIILGVYNG